MYTYIYIDQVRCQAFLKKQLYISDLGLVQKVPQIVTLNDHSVKHLNRPLFLGGNWTSSMSFQFYGQKTETWNSVDGTNVTLSYTNRIVWQVAKSYRQHWNPAMCPLLCVHVLHVYNTCMYIYIYTDYSMLLLIVYIYIYIHNYISLYVWCIFYKKLYISFWYNIFLWLFVYDNTIHFCGCAPVKLHCSSCNYMNNMNEYACGDETPTLTVTGCLRSGSHWCAGTASRAS